jgi:TonB-linked SusC/RagA family outer membrane protein
LVALPPISPVRDTLGRLTHDTVTIYYNALRHKDFTIRKLNEYRSTALGYANLKLYDGLLWRNEIGYDLYTLKENNRYLLESESGEDLNGYAFSKWAQTQNVSAKSMLNYSNKFGDITFSGVVGTEIQYVTIDETFIEGKNFPFDALETLASAGEIMGGNQELDNYSFLSYLSRVTLDYQDKYLFSVSARVDGSSRFGINNRYGFFPAASIGWVATKEEFLKDNDILSFLKPRMSYGATGNAEIGNHKWRGLYGVETYNGNPGLVPNVKANPDLTWENTHSFNVGIDFGLVENRISGEIDFYSKITEDLLFDKQIPSTSGYDVMTENIGAMENKGVEFMLNTNNLVGNFKWNTTINLSYNKNKVTDLGGLDIYDPGSSRYMNVHMVGQPMGVFYGKEYAGVASYDIPGGNLDGSDIHGGDALWYVNGENGTVDGVRLVTSRFSEANSIVLGKPNPDFIYSLTNSFSYKHSGWNFDFSFMFQGVTGNKIHLAGDPFMAGNGRYEDNQLVSQRDSWREPGDVTDVPQARLFETNGQQSRSSRYLEDGAYLKLRNLVFGVELPKSILSKIKVEQMRVYVMAQNVLTFTKYTGWDPEVSSDFVVDNLRSGIDFYSAPQARSITFGLSLGF